MNKKLCVIITCLLCLSVLPMTSALRLHKFNVTNEEIRQNTLDSMNKYWFNQTSRNFKILIWSVTDLLMRNIYLEANARYWEEKFRGVSCRAKPSKLAEEEPTYLAGDLNKDGVVDISDLTIFQTKMGNSGCVASNWCGGADLNNDGKVDAADYIDMKNLLS